MIFGSIMRTVLIYFEYFLEDYHVEKSKLERRLPGGPC